MKNISSLIALSVSLTKGVATALASITASMPAYAPHSMDILTRICVPPVFNGYVTPTGVGGGVCLSVCECIDPIF